MSGFPNRNLILLQEENDTVSEILHSPLETLKRLVKNFMVDKFQLMVNEKIGKAQGIFFGIDHTESDLGPIDRFAKYIPAKKLL